MKGIITVENKERGLFTGKIELASDMLLKEFELEGKRGRLKIGARSDNPEHLRGIIVTKTSEEEERANVAFLFPAGILEEGRKYHAVCQDCWSRQFVPWSCSFVKT